MQCKNYRAYTMAEAMAAVKADLGNEAIVLHTRTLTQGGFLGIGRKTVIEVTAAREERGKASRDAAKDATKSELIGAGAANGPSGVLGGVASRAYGATKREESKPVETIDRAQLDRDRTRLLAQAMAVKLEREQNELPRTGAPSAANANAAATAVAAAKPVENGAERAGGRLGAAFASTEANSRSVSASAVKPVAQRFVLIPANDVARAAERRSIAQAIAPATAPRDVQQQVDARPVSVSAPRVEVASEGPVANRPLAVAFSPAPSPPPKVTVELVPPDPPDVIQRDVTRPSPARPAPAPLPASLPAALPTSSPDLDAIDRLVDEVLRRPTTAPAPRPVTATTSTSIIERTGSRPARLEALYSNLLVQDVGDELAAMIAADLEASLTPEELASDHAVRSAAMQRIAALLPAPPQALPLGAAAHGSGLEPGPSGIWRRDGRPLTIAFVGPTGVGKTTTVAKIAASLKLRYGARVGLITCDTYRIAAVDQLRTYADIIGLPLEIVLSPSQMLESRQRLDELDVILIDTAGRSQNDAARLGDLAAMIRAAEPHETHLVLSSTAHERVLLREAQAFSTVGVDRVVLTKLDEAVGLGAVLRVLRQVGRSVSYLTTGQEVPQHIEAARPDRLAELMLGGALNA